MHPALLAVFFSAAISSATVAFVKLNIHDALFVRWLLLYVIFLLYRTKIMIDDLGWYADLKRAHADANPIDVLFAILTWVGWFAMAAVIGQSMEHYLGFFIITFFLSSLWIYAADYIAKNSALGDDDGSSRRLNKVLFLKSKRHARWLVANIGLVLGGILCYSAVVSWDLPSILGISNLISTEQLFNIGAGMIAVVFVFDVCCNLDSFNKSLIDAGRL